LDSENKPKGEIIWAVMVTIQTVLDELPRTYSPELYQKKCDVVYQHVFDAYGGQGNSLYAAN
jgi:type I restriction enzyme R subunit